MVSTPVLEAEFLHIVASATMQTAMLSSLKPSVWMS